ncbi:hypothetical protein L6164_031061 [Bauhinia variegata]|uniref:Uncharacterized protein n=1 Tax=Bauhinia variegata TaxID=167791 RepID=A0ACB9LE57_BAUVA|nr:hypothetical protein L6164_031061 [Bauhinia variegata]
MLRVELELPSDEPYLSRLMQDFWGRRWNLMAANVLRHTIHKPVKTVFEPFLGPQCASLPGVMATFLVSGLMHELLFYYITRAAPTWEVTWFFVPHGECLVVEFGIKRALRLSPTWTLHWAVSGSITVGFAIVSASLLFFPPLMRNGADERAIREFKNLMNCAITIMGKNE